MLTFKQRLSRSISPYGGKCGICKKKNHPYMLTDDVWNKICQGEKFICLFCAENRLGRPLEEDDFIDAPINNGCFGFDCKDWCYRNKVILYYTVGSMKPNENVSDMYNEVVQFLKNNGIKHRIHGIYDAPIVEQEYDMFVRLFYPRLTSDSIY